MALSFLKHALRHGLDQVLQKFSGGAPVRLFNELGCGELTRAIDADK
ncbi:MAG: hypothetical protein ACJAVS_002599 [Paracoccaceae bacterium]|jgi:hypothetical protein